MKVKIKNPNYIIYWNNYDPYAPIGMHIGMYDMSPSKYIEVDIIDFIKMKLKKLFKGGN